MEKLIKNRDASALLVAILIMSLLLVVGLGVNRLIIVEMKVERGLLQGGQSYYSAEGASELALHEIVASITGYEGGDSGEFDSGVAYEYEILALSDVWPCDVYGDKVFEDEDGVLWRVLEVEESVMIPLFLEEEKMEEFKVEYFVETDSGFSDDLLRWKILGINSAGLTEAISDYEEVSAGLNTATAPTSFETIDFAGTYKDYGGSWGGREYWFVEESIGTFLGAHDYNYLILTHVMEDASDENLLYLRLSEGDTDFVCEYVKIEAEGSYGEYVQQIDVLMKEGEPLPVFDFVLFEKEI